MDVFDDPQLEQQTEEAFPDIALDYFNAAGVLISTHMYQRDVWEAMLDAMQDGKVKIILPNGEIVKPNEIEKDET